MNCKRIRELILTDYLDHEMDGKKRLDLEEHLSRCRGCKKFSMEAEKVGPELFSSAANAVPPEYLWRRIRETILAGQNKAGFAAGIFRKFKGLLYIPRPVLAAITILIMILAVGTIAHLGINEASRLRVQDQIEYFDYLAGVPVSADTGADGSAGFGTQVEKYFL